MVTLLFPPNCEAVSVQIENDLSKAFSEHVSIVRTETNNCRLEECAPPQWDDLLLVVFDEHPFPEQATSFIESYLQQRPNGNCLPVATDANQQKPPKGADGIKSLVYDSANEAHRKRLIDRAGAMLGLQMQGRDGKIFISYRATDGHNLAEQLHKYLTGFGLKPFLDEAHE